MTMAYSASSIIIGHFESNDSYTPLSFPKPYIVLAI